MITDAQTNVLYLAETLRSQHLDFYNCLVALVTSEGKEVREISGTREIWARDYMPVQIARERFVQFTYDPDYLRFKKYKDTKVLPEVLWTSAGVTPTVSPFVLEGGNVVKSERKAICTTSLLDANKDVEEIALLREVKEVLDVDQLIIVPRQPGDFTGHADGVVRFVDESMVLINQYTGKDNPQFCRTLKLCLYNAGLTWIETPYNHDGVDQKGDGAAGIYINYLQMEDLIVLPSFGIPEDNLAVAQFSELFPGYRIRSIDCTEVARGGGLLNCITWNIKA